MTEQGVFYFIPQTGQTSDRPMRSNFYVYKFPGSCWDRVEKEVANAKFGSGGYVYEREVIEWFEGQDLGWNQKEGLPQ